jgi:hypothetical protein
MKKVRNTRVRLAVALLGCAGAAGVMAQEPNPYYIGASQAFTRENNVFRVPEGQPETDDTYSTTSLLAGVNQPFGRQRILADAAVRHNRYRNNDQLDHTGYGLDLNLDWETIESLSGRFGYTAKQSLARYGADLGPAITARNLERSQEFVARGPYGGASVLALEASYVNRRLDYTAPEYAFQELRQDVVRAGLLYRPGASLTLGIGVRRTDGEYPFAVEPIPGTFQSDDFKRNDVDLTAVWVPTGQSTLRARLSYTKEEHELVTSRDISSSTGALSWDYKPTAKLAFTTEVIRDTGAETAFASTSPGGTAGVGNNSSLSNTFFLRGLYEVTAKIQFEASGRYVERDLVNTQGGGLPPTGSDRRTEYRLGLTWAPTRSLLFGCSVGQDRRRTNSALSYPYSADIASCLGQFKLQ